MGKKTSGKAGFWLASVTKPGDHRGIGAIHREVVATPVHKKDKVVQTEEPSNMSIFNLKGILPAPAIPFHFAAKSEKIGKNEQSVQTNEPSTSNQVKKTEEDATNYKTKPGSGNIFNSVGILLVVAIACIFAVVFISTPEPELKNNFDYLVTIFGDGVNELQQSFTNQTKRFWKILKHRGLAHLRNKHPTQPLVFLLAAPPPAHEWVDCLATKLAEKLDPKQKRFLAIIDGNTEKSNPADKTTKKMHEFLTEKFGAGRRVALIHHLELLPPPSPLLFYSYCDHRNAPHKYFAIIFTVHLPEEPSSSLSPREAEGTVEKYLANEVWSRVDKDAVAALLSRIAEDMVALMNGESSSSLKAFCS